jgi:predicted MPP superfamily phosphohydrolase
MNKVVPFKSPAQGDSARIVDLPPAGPSGPGGSAPPGVSRRHFLRNALLGGAGVSAVAGSSTAAAGCAEAAIDLDVTMYRPVPVQWPAGQQLSITVVADLHAGGPNMGVARIREVVERANALKSDLVVLLGDFFATHHFITEHVPHDVWASELARLEAPLGRYAILGNHDWWFDVEGTRAALRKAGIPLLENEVVHMGDAGRRFWLAGLGDQLAYRLGYNKFRGVDDLQGTLARITNEDPVILLAHEPDIFVNVPDRVALTLSGHTHGGQVRVPLIWPKLVPSRYGARFAYGHIYEEGRHMIVSGGLGTSFVPMRLGVPPEILRVELGA